jgi:hypothetical protein
MLRDLKLSQLCWSCVAGQRVVLDISKERSALDTSWNTDPTTQCHIQEELGPQFILMFELPTRLFNCEY